jgi:hypothetical protein
MANISYADYENLKSKPTNKSTKEYKVDYFSLKDDGDEAIVRFPYTSAQEFNIVTVHVIKTTNKDGKEIFRRVSCLREAGDPVSKCPLCLAGDKVVDKFFIKLVEYVKDGNGRVVPKARVWERPANFARKIKSLLDEYGDLTNHIFKIKRRGARGSMKTDYDAIYIPETSPIYKPEVYFKDFSDFEGFKIAGNFYLVKTEAEINSFLQTGDFPRVESTNQPQGQSYTGPVATNTSTTSFVPQQPTSAPTVDTNPQGSVNPTEGRPQRYKF